MRDLVGATLLGAIILGSVTLVRTRKAPYDITSLLWAYLLSVTVGPLFVPELAEAEVGAVLVIGLLAFAAGVVAADLVAPKAQHPGDMAEHAGPSPAAPADRHAFRGVLLAVTLSSIVLTVWHLRRYGIPLLAGTWYTTGLEATSGFLDRLVYALGPGALLLWSLAWYHLHRVAYSPRNGRRSALALALLAFGVHVAHGVALGSKGTPVIAVIAVVLHLHHVHRTITIRRLTAIIGGGGALLAVVVFYHVGLRGGWPAAELLAYRVFVIPAENLGWLVDSWSKSHSYFWGETVIMELRRIAHHASLAPEGPLYNQFLPNLQSGSAPPSDPGLLSAEFTLLGAGYANLGWLGTAVAGGLAGWTAEVGTRILRRQRMIGPVAGVVVVTLMLTLLATFRTGNALISIETWAATQALPLALLAGTYRLVAGAGGRAAWVPGTR